MVSALATIEPVLEFLKSAHVLYADDASIREDVLRRHYIRWCEFNGIDFRESAALTTVMDDRFGHLLRQWQHVCGLDVTNAALTDTDRIGDNREDWDAVVAALLEEALDEDCIRTVGSFLRFKVST